MQHRLQTELTDLIRAWVTEWLEEAPETTTQTILNALHDAGQDFEERSEMARDDADERGDWLLERQRDWLL